MKASRLVLCLLAAYCMLGLAHAGEDESAMDVIVVTAKRPVPMSYGNIIADEAEAAVVDFAELTLTPPRVAIIAGRSAPPRGQLALTEEGKTRI